MKNKFEKYLEEKDASSYTEGDKILKMYLDGELEGVFKRNGFCDIEISAYEGDSPYGMHVTGYFEYHNITVTFEFTQSGYGYILSNGEGETAREIDIDFKYGEDFSIAEAAKALVSLVREHPDFEEAPILSGRQRRYRAISGICFVIPIATVVTLIIYRLVTKTSLMSSPLVLIPVIVPFIIYVAMNRLSKKSNDGE